MASSSRWWVRELATVEDPISLEPLRTLRYPPFQCKADLELTHRTSSDYFDGHVLAMYLVSTASFLHPISRRDLMRDECVALDEYCTQHGLCGAHVTKVYDCAKDPTKNASVAMMQAQAEDVLQSLFGHRAEARALRRTAAPREEPFVGDSGLSVVDDDLRPSHGTAVDVVDALAEAFPALPSSGGSTVSSSSSPFSAWDLGATGGQHLQPPPPPPPKPQSPSAEERERQSRARLARERQAWAAAAAAAEAKAADEAAAQAAAAAYAEEAAMADAYEWERAVAQSERHRAAAKAQAFAAAEANEAAAAAASKELHRAAAAGEASRVYELLEKGWDPRLQHREYGDRVAYDVASSEAVRGAFRQYRADHAGAWDWLAARVPLRSEAEEEERAEEERQRAREKKKVAERSRKERRKGEQTAREEAIKAARVAAAANDEEALVAALYDTKQLGCEPEDVKDITEKLAALQDPQARERRARERRAEAAQKRLGGLTTAQADLLRGERVERPKPSGESVQRPDGSCGGGPSVEVSSAADLVHEVTLSFKGRCETIRLQGRQSITELFAEASRALDLPEERFSLKIILKGKSLERNGAFVSDVLGANGPSLKLMVMASAKGAVDALQSTTSDPKVASFASEHGSRKGGITAAKGVPARRTGNRLSR